jgi:phosphoribosylaminoimidazolecarboxamide formyltransferase/IMP cyclohydrolase
VSATRAQRLRYGENPHQQAAFYVTDRQRGIGAAEQVQGKELSYNNLADADAALELISEFSEPTVAIIKHANPCGVAIGRSLAQAYQKALACDPVSAYGGIVALNRSLDAATAGQITQLFTEVVIAPDAEAEARALLAAKPNLRLLLTGPLAAPTGELLLRSVAGGLLVQERDMARVDDVELKVVTERAPTPAEIADLRFAFAVCKHVRSNAIVFARDGATVGVGAGQMSRLDSVAIAVRKAAETARAAGAVEPGTVGSVVASDAFVPFADGLEAALQAGATAVIQPGGSMRDAEVIAAADRAGAAMVLTGRRHFRH